MTRMRMHKPVGRGQALVEFALVLPVLLVLSMLIIQYGIIFYTTLSVTNLTREGARYAATAPVSDDPIFTRIQNVMPPNIKYSDLNITISPDEGDSVRAVGSGGLITVTITYDMSKKLFLPSTFFGAKIFSSTYSTQATMMVE